MNMPNYGSPFVKPSVAVNVLQVEKSPDSMAEFIVQEYLPHISANASSREFYVKAMRKALQNTCGDGVPTWHQGKKLVCEFRIATSDTMPLAWMQTTVAMACIHRMENIILRIPEAIIKHTEAVNKLPKQLAVLMVAFSSFGSIPIVEFIRQMKDLDPKVVENAMSVLSDIALLMKGELNKSGETLTSLVSEMRFIGNE